MGRYITEGQGLIDNQTRNTYSALEYINAMDNWSDRVAKDIRKNKGQSETTLFLDDGHTQPLRSLVDGDSEFMERHHVAQIIGFRLLRLKELQKRL